MSCLALCCLVAAAAAATAATAATAAGSAGPAAAAVAVAAAYLPATELRAPCGARSGRHCLGDRWPTLAWPGMRAGRCANALGCVWHRRLVCLFGLHPSLHLYLWLVPSL